MFGFAKKASCRTCGGREKIDEMYLLTVAEWATGPLFWVNALSSLGSPLKMQMYLSEGPNVLASQTKVSNPICRSCAPLLDLSCDYEQATNRTLGHTMCPPLGKVDPMQIRIGAIAGMKILTAKVEELRKAGKGPSGDDLTAFVSQIKVIGAEVLNELLIRVIGRQKLPEFQKDSNDLDVNRLIFHFMTAGKS